MIARENAEVVTFAQRGVSGRSGKGNFSTDSYRPGFTRYGAPYTGQLPRPFARMLDEAFNEGRISQVIYSYSTPIAWHDTMHGWIIPDVRYSITTSSKHQTHLYRLHGRRISLPWDATPEDARRVLSGELIFSRGRTYPGPNYVLI